MAAASHISETVLQDEDEDKFRTGSAKFPTLSAVHLRSLRILLLLKLNVMAQRSVCSRALPLLHLALRNMFQTLNRHMQRGLPDSLPT
jgi:hypothetical protein